MSILSFYLRIKELLKISKNRVVGKGINDYSQSTLTVGKLLFRSLGVCFLILFSLGVGKLWYIARDGFSLSRISLWEDGISVSLSMEAKKALDQPYFYLGRGRQCFAFASEDGNYVVKLPRTNHYRLSFWLKSLPFLNNYREKVRQRQQKSEQFLLKSFQISFEELREQTAIVALHLGPSFEEGALTLIDSLGKAYYLPLGKTAFILQKKKPIFIEEFERLGRDERRLMLQGFLDCVVERAKKGILNKDALFLTNFGFDGKNVFQIDVGSFYRREEIVGREAYQKALRETVAPVRDWLSEVDGTLLQELDDMLDPLYQEIL